ncbi:MAG: hypothetical protein ACI8QC_002639 [Planctomycetota bacterium]|jgi:hypothetical protein
MRKPILLLLLVLIAAAIGTVLTMDDPKANGLEVGFEAPSGKAVAPDAPTELAKAQLDSGEGRAAVEPQAADSPAEKTQASNSPQSSAGWITGRLVDAAGKPIASVPVVLNPRSVGVRFSREEEPAPTEGTTNKAGEFRLRLAAESLHLRVMAEGFARFDQRVGGLTSEGFDFGDVVLDAGVLLSGRVVGASGQGIEGVSIMQENPNAGEGLSFFSGGDVQVATSEEDGNFRVTSQAVGPWRLRFVHKEYQDRMEEGRTASSGEVVAGLEIELSPGGIIAGSVSQLKGVDLAQLSVQALPVPSRTNAAAFLGAGRSADVRSDGSFELLGLEQEGKYRLSVREASMSTDERQSPRRSASVEAVVGDGNIVLIYGTGARVRWQAREVGTDLPVESYAFTMVRQGQISIGDPTGLGATERPEGRAESVGLWPGEQPQSYTLTLSAPGFRTLEQAGISVQQGQTVDLGVLLLTPSPSLRVTVTDAKSGEPVAGAHVAFRPEGAEESTPGMVRMRVGPGGRALDERGVMATTDEEGVAILSVESPYTGPLTIRKSGYAPFTREGVEGPSTGRVDLSETLRRGGSVVVALVDSEGAPKSGVSIEYRDGEGPGQHQSQRTNADGEALFANLSPGSHGFRVAAPGAERPVGVVVRGMTPSGAAWDEVNLVGEEEQELLLQMPPRTVLSGTVREDGKPLAGALVSLREDSPSGRMAANFGSSNRVTTDSDGRFELGETSPGAHVLTVDHTNRAMPYELDVLLVAETESMRVDLPITIVEGRVRDEEGHPIAGAEVRGVLPQRGGMRMMITMSDDEGAPAAISVDTGDANVVYTDEDGRYLMRGVAADVPFKIEVRAEGYKVARSEDLELAPGEQRTDFDVAVAQGGQVTVEVLTADGKPATSSMVEARYVGELSGITPRMVPVRSNEVLLEDMEIGPWEIRLRSFRSMGSGAEEAEPTPIVVERGGEHRLQLDA